MAQQLSQHPATAAHRDAESDLTGARREAPRDRLEMSTEHLERPDAIQAGVYVLVLERDGRLLAWSANCNELAAGQASAGAWALADLLDRPSRRRVEEALMLEDANLGFHCQASSGISLWVSGFATDRGLGLLLEPTGTGDVVEGAGERGGEERLPQRSTDNERLLFKVMERIKVLQNSIHPLDQAIDAFATGVVDILHTIAGYSRTMIYRFDDDWNGTVIAEARQPQVSTSYLGLSFPSTDIGPKARAVFQRIGVRPVNDIEAPGVELIYREREGSAHSLSLADCYFRDVAQCHRQYFRNMGVRSSLIIALVANGRMWGLIACHNEGEPRQIGPIKRAVLNGVADIISIALSRVIDRHESATVQKLQSTLNSLLSDKVEGIGSINTFGQALNAIMGLCRELLCCTGLAWVDGDEVTVRANAPSEAGVLTIAAFVRSWCAEHGRENLSTGALTAYGLELDAEDATRAAGVVSSGGRGSNPMLLLFKAAARFDVTWAGDPDQRVKAPDGCTWLHPRLSFEQYVSEHRNQSLPWDAMSGILSRTAYTSLSQLHWLKRSEADSRAIEKARVEALLAKEEMAHAAMHDALTGLGNRRLLDSRINKLQLLGRRYCARVGVLLLDLDRFKAVNDTKGHDVGDLLLKRVAAILNDSVRGHDLVCRLGGDEFVVLVGGFKEEERLHPVLERLSDRIIANISEPQHIDEHICHVGTSIGVSVKEIEAVNLVDMLREADIALYESKHQGGSCCTFHTSQLDSTITQAVQLVDELRRSMAEEQLEMHYQPQFDVASGRIVGAECLMRWRHPSHGLLRPDSFLAIAQKNGLMRELDIMGIRSVERQYLRWCESGLSIERLSVNISAELIGHPSLLALLAELRIPREVLRLELLETIYLDGLNDTIKSTLTALREMGILVELDDFGTGRSSILSLVATRPAALKIDKDLVIPALSSDEARQLLQLVVLMGQSSNVEVTLEGVENEGHIALARELGCDTMQGYALSHPLKAGAFEALLKEQQSRSEG
ncbi:EAL domain-containing protein [Synechococcus sp. RSCCF101]|uniref:bifunctional diguanylate cyclase/phosphodiesterase n=1 Tax=Synechococcus sp. RSCCF101 TaxID=2511069 RepID=UPI0012457CBF|nr:EAL domain-containing protein [Synechococcus sp. RSCCF101]QEY31311.1 EAL domain-containing protein [Synechococcus sp. RSCCF101]